MPKDIEVFADDASGLRGVGTLRRYARRGRESVSFEYNAEWLRDADGYSLEPALALGRGSFAPGEDRAMFGSIGDSAPDTWGRRLMQRAERRAAEREGRPVHALAESDYLLGVTDVSRSGALRFRLTGEEVFRAPALDGVPSLLELERLLQVTERIFRDEETDEDLRLIFAPGSSLGGARPKASVIDRYGRLAIAKFPKETDEYSIELWEAVALELATRAGMRTSEHELIRVAGNPVLLSRRFDRNGETRIPYLSALSMLALRDGERSSYPELVDAVTRFGAHAARDSRELYRRAAFNVLISNVDDHLRNHGFLWFGRNGWTLSPAFDLNPTPADTRARILTTAISPDDPTCDIDLVLSAAEYYDLEPGPARAIVKAMAAVTATWRETASAFGARPAEIRRMASAFEHDDLRKGLAL